MRFTLLMLFSFNFAFLTAQDLTKEYIDPHDGYSDAVEINSGGIKTIYIAGQVGEGSTLEEQIRVAFERVITQLEKSGATFKDVVKHTTYIKNYKDEDLPAFRKVRKQLFGHLEYMPPNVLVGVTALYQKDILVEMDAIAMIPAKD